MTPLAAYLLLFVAVGIGFILVHLLAGKLIRPNKPEAAKGTIYECGEPTIGSAWVQFDVRFYVVALLFVIFDVEVAFFFPWAVVFGKANSLAAVWQPNNAESYHAVGEQAWELLPPVTHADHESQLNRLREVTPEGLKRLQELRAKEGQLKAEGQKLPNTEALEKEHLEAQERIARETHTQARYLAWLAFLEIAVFFGVLLVGFAYLWKRGDLAWVRSLAAEQSEEAPPTPAPPLRQPVAAPLAGAATHS